MNRDSELEFRVAEVLDNMQGLEAQVVHRRFLGGYPHEQTAAELGISVEMSQEIAVQGLKKIKDTVFPQTG